MGHETQHANHLLHWLELGAVGVAGATIAAPYVLPMVGVGTQMDAITIASMCGNTLGGLTQSVEHLLRGVPGIGGTLASAGWGSSIIAAGIGIGGTMLGDYIHTHYDKKGHIPWGTVIKYASLATSVLIALPSILSGISMGITFLALAFGGSDAMFAARGALQHTIGFSGTAHFAPTGLAALAPHLLTCGRALLPLGAAAMFSTPQHGEAAMASESYSMRLINTPMPLRGQPCRLDFQLLDNRSGRVLNADELQTVHTKQLHTMIVDSSLRDYHHIHPVFDASRNVFSCQFTPNLSTDYAMWNDFTLKGDTLPTHTKTDLCLMRCHTQLPTITHSSRAFAGGLLAEISSERPLRAQVPGMLNVTIRDATGHIVTDLEPIMGTYAHMAGFSRDGQHFIHTHPVNEAPEAAGATGVGQLQFHITPSSSGPAQFFLQVARHGKVITLSFGQQIAPAPHLSQWTDEGKINPAHTYQMALENQRKALHGRMVGL